jgi:uncharacterized protein (DUF1330 family)
VSAFLIAEISVEFPDLYSGYKELVAPTLGAFGGAFVVRGGEVETLEGGWTPERIVVLRFETKALARAWWNSAEYAPAKEIRQAAAATQMIIVEGADENG